MAGYVPTIPEWFNTRKAAQVTAYLASKNGGQINILRATKLIYLADRLSMERREYPITGDQFVSMPFGPVNSFTYSYMTGAARIRKRDWEEFIDPRAGNDLVIARPVITDDLDELSHADTAILEETWDTFKDIVDQFKLVEWVHEYCPEWKDPSGSSVPLDLATIFKTLGKEDPVELAEQVQAERRLVLSLSKK